MNFLCLAASPDRRGFGATNKAVQVCRLGRCGAETQSTHQSKSPLPDTSPETLVWDCGQELMEKADLAETFPLTGDSPAFAGNSIYALIMMDWEDWCSEN